jgi:hypothetical protein
MLHVDYPFRLQAFFGKVSVFVPSEVTEVHQEMRRCTRRGSKRVLH